MPSLLAVSTTGNKRLRRSKRPLQNGAPVFQVKQNPIHKEERAVFKWRRTCHNHR